MTAQAIRETIEEWGRLWGVPGLEDQVSVSFSARLRSSLGRARLSTGTVTLRADLRRRKKQLLSVLCHEVAHVAVWKMRPNASPHGSEWQRLVALAGFAPEVRARSELNKGTTRVHGATLSYEHRCPVCQSVRFARRPVPRWRCAECQEIGLPGELIISRLD